MFLLFVRTTLSHYMVWHFLLRHNTNMDLYLLNDTSLITPALAKWAFWKGLSAGIRNETVKGKNVPSNSLHIISIDAHNDSHSVVGLSTGIVGTVVKEKHSVRFIVVSLNFRLCYNIDILWNTLKLSAELQRKWFISIRSGIEIECIVSSFG